MDNEENAPARFAEQAQKRHESRDAEHYLKNLLKASQYVDNVAAVLETASEEVKATAIFKDIQDRNRRNLDLHSYQKPLQNLVDNADQAAYRLREGLAQAERLFTGSEGKLARTSDINNLQNAAQIAASTLSAIAEQLPTKDNGLSEETIINAQAALDVAQNKLARVVRGDNNMADSLKQYNEDYAKRMAAAQRDAKGGRIEGFKERQAATVAKYKTSSRKLEENRTGVASFRENVEAARTQEQEAPAASR